MEKRRITKQEAEAAPELHVKIPDFNGDSHPFSQGKKPEIYTEEGLKKVAAKGTERTYWFLAHFCAVFDIIGAPVPFFFKTANGELRSLDAGCLGFLANKTTPMVKFNIGSSGFISSVEPLPEGRQQVEHFVPIYARKMTA